MKLVQNRAVAHNAVLTAEGIVACDAAAKVLLFVEARPDHKRMPLVSLPGLARVLGVGANELKEEGRRVGMKSFKALGDAYAVARLVQKHAGAKLGRSFAHADLQREEVKSAVCDLTVCCATDGNHGRSVAARAVLVDAAA